MPVMRIKMVLKRTWCGNRYLVQKGYDSSKVSQVTGRSRKVFVVVDEHKFSRHQEALAFAAEEERSLKDGTHA
jgi:hypothetical protein